MRRIPGVAAASFSENGIFSGTESATRVQVEGFTARTADDSTVNYDRVGPGYFKAIGARLMAGRDLTERDDERAPRVALVNTTMAAHYFPHGEALGHRLMVDSVTYEIVGVVADTKDHELRQAPGRRMYLPAYQAGPLPIQFTFELRAAGDPVKLVAAARRELAAVNGSMMVLDNDPLTSLMRLSISQDLLVARVASLFGLLALALAALGLYGVMTYTTLRRTSEFGVRMALGADGGQVRRMVLREAMTLVAGGTLVGVPLALAATRLLRSQLFGVELVDLPSIAAALGGAGGERRDRGLPARRAGRAGGADRGAAGGVGSRGANRRPRLARFPSWTAAVQSGRPSWSPDVSPLASGVFMRAGCARPGPSRVKGEPPMVNVFRVFIARISVAGFRVTVCRNHGVPGRWKPFHLPYRRGQQIVDEDLALAHGAQETPRPGKAALSTSSTAPGSKRGSTMRNSCHVCIADAAESRNTKSRCT